MLGCRQQLQAGCPAGSPWVAPSRGLGTRDGVSARVGGAAGHERSDGSPNILHLHNSGVVPASSLHAHARTRCLGWHAGSAATRTAGTVHSTRAGRPAVTCLSLGPIWKQVEVSILEQRVDCGDFENRGPSCRRVAAPNRAHLAGVG